MKPEAADVLVRRWLQASGAALLLLALGVLIGRFAGLRALVTVVPDGVPMAFPTVVGFILSGAAFLLFGREQLRGGRLIAASLIAFGLGTLLLYALAEPMGISRFSYNPAAPVISKGVRFDGRMSPNAAGAFALVGATLLLISAPRFKLRFVGPCIALLLAVSLLALISHLTGLRSAVAWWRYTAMAVHTGGAFLVIGVALLFWLVRRVRVAEGAIARTLPFFLIAGTAVLVLGAVVLVSNEQRQESARLENHALQVGAGIDRFITSVARLESSTRAFALTGDAIYLERIDVHRASTAEAVENLVRLTADNPAQHERALSLRPLVSEKFAVNREQVRARQERGAEAAAAVLRAEAPELMAGLRAATDGLQAEERRVLARRRIETDVNEQRLQWVLVAGAALTIALVAAAFALVHRAQLSLQEVNDRLEERVRTRTAEVQATASQVLERERRFRFLADAMPQLVWTARPDGSIESLNQGWMAFLGVSSEAAAIAAYPGAAHPEDAEVMAREWDAMLRQARPGSGEVRLRRGDGVYRWHLWRAHPQRDAAGTVLRWVGTSTDIHDQKMAEEQLEKRVAERTAELATSEARFRQAFDFAGIGMAIVGLQGHWLRVNNALCEILGYTQSELLRKTFQDLTHPDDLAADLTHLRELVEGRRRFYQIEKRYFHRAGHVVWVRLTVSVVRDAAGQPVHFVSQMEDITQSKHLEETLARARDQAVEASRLKSEFLATMSHEIRTPMNGVIGMTSLLRDTPLNEAQAEYVRTIEASGEALLAILNDILDYSKIEAGRIELDVTPFDLRQCVEDAVDLFAGRAQEKNIELVYQIDSAVPGWVEGDPIRLRQVLVNLLGNALKFTERGEVQMMLASEAADPGNSGQNGHVRLKFTVKDTGIGIPPEGMSRLFKSFSQVDASTTRRFGGTGLGLAISRRLVELMGGSIDVESAPGVGSTFRFDVTMARSDLIDETLPAVAPVELNGRRLLIVDDNTTNRRVLLGLAAGWGMQVREAASAADAIALLQADPRCDVAVLDMHMPDVDGEQLARDIRALPGGGSIPLVMLTSLGRRPATGDFAQWLTKPVKPDALFTALRRCLLPGLEPVRTRVTPPGETLLATRFPLRVLLAEDNPVNRKVAVLLLERLGYHVAVVTNGLEAVEAAGATEYDVILMDVEMPGIDGFEATRRIRAQGRSSPRPWIIALTAAATQGDRERAHNAGMNDFVTKPVRGETLSEALLRAHAALHNPAG